MGILVGVGVIVVIGAIMLAYGQSRVDRPLSEWGDDELARQLPRFQRQVSNLFTSGNTAGAAKYASRLKEIESEIAARNTLRTASAVTAELQPILDRAAKFQAQGMTEQDALRAATEEWKKSLQ